MINPMPFCPSLPPCAKLTAVQVKISNARMPRGGGASASGGLYSLGLRSRTFINRNSRNDAPKPISGAIHKPVRILVA